jgi:hypothetical protein
MLIVEGTMPFFFAHSFWPPARFTSERSNRITSFWSSGRIFVFGWAASVGGLITDPCHGLGSAHSRTAACTAGHSGGRKRSSLSTIVLAHRHIRNQDAHAISDSQHFSSTPARVQPFNVGIPIGASVRGIESDDRSTSSMISNFSDAEYLIKRPPHPRERFF